MFGPGSKQGGGVLILNPGYDLHKRSVDFRGELPIAHSEVGGICECRIRAHSRVRATSSLPAPQFPHNICAPEK
jgi:hypothetical protein